MKPSDERPQPQPQPQPQHEHQYHITEERFTPTGPAGGFEHTRITRICLRCGASAYVEMWRISPQWETIPEPEQVEKGGRPDW